jgi:hypothetical protein
MFLIGMLVYNVAVPVCNLGYEVGCSWLYFWGASIFIAEACAEIVWSLEFPPERLTQFQKLGPSGAGDRLRAVNWELWSGVFFMIPSIFYLAETLVDPNIVGQGPAQALRAAGVDVSTFTSVCDWCGASLFVVDAVMRYCAQWCSAPEFDADSSLVRFKVWTASSFSSIDWMLWGDIMFVVAAVLGLCIKFSPESLVLAAISSGTWTFDAILYMFAAFLTWRSDPDIAVDGDHVV